MTSLLLLLLFLIGCDNDNIETYRVAKSPSITKNIQTTSTSENSLKWDAPKGWIQSSGSKMRLASFNIPYSSGYGDLSIMVLSGDGGGVEANINRWRGQISLEPQTISDINKISEKRKNKLGEYQIFEVINNENKEKAFICAIIPSTDTTIFVKLSISASGISEIKENFIYFCDSFKLNDE
tara:strand:+ start:75 stop:617 length:543 start_codon:yes stop_codon:yes gene_type:complete